MVGFLFGSIWGHVRISQIPWESFIGAAGDGGQGVSAKCQQCTVSCGARNLEETPQWQGGCDFLCWCFYACYYWLPGFKRAEVQELRQRRWEEWGLSTWLNCAFCLSAFSFLKNRWTFQHLFAGKIRSIWVFPKMVVPPKSSILIGISIISHSFWGTTIFGNTHLGQTPFRFCGFFWLGYLRCVAGIDGWGYGSSKEAAGANPVFSVLKPNLLHHLLHRKMCKSSIWITKSWLILWKIAGQVPRRRKGSSQQPG